MKCQLRDNQRKVPGLQEETISLEIHRSLPKYVKAGIEFQKNFNSQNIASEIKIHSQSRGLYSKSYLIQTNFQKVYLQSLASKNNFYSQN